MFVWRCPTCVAVLRDEHGERCPVCHENLRRRPPIVVGGTHAADWWRRAPWQFSSHEQVEAHFTAKPFSNESAP
jgi:hypothetical protein